jgi:DNA-binding FadR family transcriptional regulator
MRDFYQLRAAIDGLASRLASERVACQEATAAEIDLLRSRLAAGRSLPSLAPIHDWIAADVAFHQSIYRMSGNSAIAATVAEWWPHFKRCMGASLAKPEVRIAIWDEHAAIADGIFSGSPRTAESAAVHHTEKAGSALYQRLIEEAAAVASAHRA